MTSHRKGCQAEGRAQTSPTWNPYGELDAVLFYWKIDMKEQGLEHEAREYDKQIT